MKKLSFVWKLLLISVIFVFALTSCEYLPFCSHRDENDDSLCDKCGEEYTDGKDVFEHVCTEAEREENRVEGNCKSGGSYDLVKYCKECEKIISVTKVTIETPAHKASDWIVDTAPSCDKEGLRHKECTDCGAIIEKESIPKTDHNYDANGVCTICGAKDSANNENSAYSVGLEYTISNDGKYYILDGIGTCKDTEIIIPPTYNGLPVEAIGERAFENCLDITKVVIPDGVKRIGKIGSGATSSFRNCENLTEIVIPDSVSYIGAMAGESAFYGCKKLWSYENGVYYVNDWALTYQGWCTGASNTHDTPKSLLEIRDGTIGIGNQAFIHGPYTEVVIPSSVKYVCQVAFLWWNNAERVYYTGTEEQWSKILIDESNDGITDHPVYYYSETAPTTLGNFWHYVNGVPTTWEPYVEHIHSYTAQTTAPTCTEQGYTTYTCACGDSYVSDYVAKMEHNFVDRKCESCGSPYYSEGLSYRLSFNGDSYEVSGIGTCKDTEIYIPSSYEGIAVTGIAEYTFYGNSTVTAVYMTESITRIGSFAFWNCTGLKEITIPKNAKSVSSQAFTGCVNLESIYVDEGNTNYKSVDGVLYSINEKEILRYPPAKAGKKYEILPTVTYIHGMAFDYASSLTEVIIPIGLSRIDQGAFDYCTSLKEIVFPEKVDLYSCSFIGCTSLVKVVLPKNIESLSGFSGCASLEYIEIPESVKSMPNGTFRDCTSLKAVVLPKMTYIVDYTFENCTSLEYIVIPDSLTNINRCAFTGVPSTLIVYYEGTEEQWNTINIDTLMNGTFLKAPRYYYSETAPTTEGNFWHYVDGVPTAWEAYVAPHIHSYTTATTAPTCTEQGYTTYTCACGDSYVSDYVPALGHTEVTDAAVAPTCTANGLTEGKHCSVCSEVLVAQNVIPAGHNYVDGKCSVCDEIDYSYYTFTLLTDGTYEISVNDINKLPDDIVIPREYDGVLVTRIANDTFNADKGRNQFDSITIPDTIKSIGENAFFCCVINDVYVYDLENWLSIDFESYGSYPHRQITYISTLHILNSNGKELTEVIIPENITSIGYMAFSLCHSLETVFIHNEVTKIDYNAFDYCSNLTNVIIGNKVTCIGDYAFDGCTKLKAVYYVGTLSDWNAIDIENEYNSNSVLLNATRYYYSETQPTTEGNFWHYVDGVPTVWDAHIHSYTTATTAPTCTEQGYTTYTCYCSDSYVGDYVPALGHTEAIDSAVDATCTTSGLTEGKHCSACGEILVAQNLIPARHNYVDGKCSVCGEFDYSYYTFTLLADGTYEISATNPKKLPSNVVVPSEYNEITVTRIAENAFRVDAIFIISSVTIPNTIKSIGKDAFRNFCPDSIYIYDVNNWLNISFENHDSLPQWQNAYGGCTYFLDDNGNEITDIVIDDGITSIGCLNFANARNLKSVIIPDSVTIIDYYAFYFCNNLTSIVIGDNVVSIGDMAFYNCLSLSAVYYNGVASDWDKIVIGGSYYSNASLLDATRYYYSETQPTEEGNFWHYVDGVPTVWDTYVKPEVSDELAYKLSDDGTYYIVTGIGTFNGTDLVIPNEYKGLPVKKIEVGAFSGNESITSVMIGNNVIDVAVVAFACCKNLTSVIIPNNTMLFQMYVFEESYSITAVYFCGTSSDWVNVDIHAGNEPLTDATLYYYSETEPTTSGNFWHWVDNVPTIWDAYVEPETPTYSEGLAFTSNGDGTCYVSGFGSCADTDVVIPEISPEGWTVTGIGYGAFSDCLDITSVIMPDTVTEIGVGAFNCCLSMSYIYIPDSVVTIKNSAFSGCSSLTEINLPSGITSIENDILMGCDSLTYIRIPENVTYIGQYSFWDSLGITTLELPISLKTISDGAFEGCYSLTTVYYHGTPADWNSISIGGNYYLELATVYYYSETAPTTEGNFWHYVDGVPTVW